MTAPGFTKKILVTGSRGKSSVVRLLHAGLNAAGIPAWSRITGTDPRQLEPNGERPIGRTAGAHVEEMRWWLKQLPRSAQAVVMENSAISPELQPLAARWLHPDLIVFTNALPDHQEAWGAGEQGAADALLEGVPDGSRVVVPGSLDETGLVETFQRKSCEIVFTPGAGEGYRAVNLGLAETALRELGIVSEDAIGAMGTLTPDRHDFRVRLVAGAEMALAFSANDIQSTKNLFDSLGWKADETRLLYNHRADRPSRLASYRDWIANGGWREVIVTGGRPLRTPPAAAYVKLGNINTLKALLKTGERVFGCGNIAGLPPELYRE